MRGDEVEIIYTCLNVWILNVEHHEGKLHQQISAELERYFIYISIFYSLNKITNHRVLVHPRLSWL